MASNLLTAKFDLRFVSGTDGLAPINIDDDSYSRAPSSTIYSNTLQTVDTTEEAVGLGDVTSPAEIWVKNLDATNYIELGATTGVYNISLLAGKWAFFPLKGTTLFAKANTAAVIIQVVCFSD